MHLKNIDLDKKVKLCSANGKTVGLYIEKIKEYYEVFAAVSNDNGNTFENEKQLFRLPVVGEFLGLEAATARDGNTIHIFMLNDGFSRNEMLKKAGEGERPSAQDIAKVTIDIWHCSFDFQKGVLVAEPRCIWKGYCGSLNSCIVTSSGRVLLPISYKTNRTWKDRGEEFSDYTFWGIYNSAVIYSDDGVNFSISNSLAIPVPDIVSSYGAVEPVCVELEKDKIWMLIRNQLGVFFESFSTDGSFWPQPKPTRIITSDSPAGLARATTGELILFLNSCRNFPYAHGGRHVLHAAVSRDNAKSFTGFVEVGVDPFAQVPPPPSGDHGTAYPFPYAAGDGSVIFSTGQGHGRVLNKKLLPKEIIPCEGDLNLDDAHVFGTTIERKADGLLLPPSSGACVLNFFAAKKGRLILELEGNDAKDVKVLLNDAFSTPFDPLDEVTSCAVIEMDRVSGAIKLEVSFDFEKLEIISSCGKASVWKRPNFGVNYIRVKAASSGELLLKKISLAK